MMLSRPQYLAWSLTLIGALLYASSRAFAPNEHLHSSVWETGPSPLLLQAALAGPNPGLLADLNLLSVFSLYDDIRHDFTAKQRLKAWEFLAAYLERSQALDPRFQDPYRLAGGLLGNIEGFESRAVDLLELGTQANPDSWEYPFFGGFLAHDRLHDDQRAFRLMSIAAKRPGVPPMVLGLAAKFLANDKGPEASIQFLELMLKMMPEGYQEPIRERILKLRKEFPIDGK